MPKLFTAETATRTLPLVSRIVDDIRETYVRLEAMGDRLSGDDTIEGTARERLQEEFDGLASQLTEFARELEAIGCVLKDPSSGLVDFPGEIDGEVVWLCWQAGETDVGWWHPQDSGFTGRQPLPATTRRS